MSFDLAAFEAKLQAIAGILPALGNMVTATEALAPNAAGLTKASLVIQTAIAVEPALAASEQVLAATITGIVNAFRSAGTLPAPVTVAVTTNPATKP